MKHGPCDVAVVGAGPAGSIAALLLSKLGHKVILIDRQIFPRDKACGDLLGRRAIQRLHALGLAHVLGDSLRLTGVRVTTPYGGVREDRYPDAADAMTVVPRLKLDAALLQAAQNAGAHLVAAKYLDSVPTAEGHEILARQLGGKEVTLATRVLVGADGALSRVAASCSAARPNLDHTALALRQYCRSSTPLEPLLELFWPLANHPYATSPSYAWMCPISAHEANIGVCVYGKGAGTRLRHNLDSTIQALKRTRPDLSSISPRSRPRAEMIRFDYRPETCWGPGFILIGDAAGLADPSNGEGLSFAIESASVGADVIDRYLAGRSSTLAEYAYESAKAFQARIVPGLERLSLGYIEANDPNNSLTVRPPQTGRSSRPLRSDRTAVLDAGDTVLLWPENGLPTLMSKVGATLWSMLDGSTTLQDLGDDLVATELCRDPDPSAAMARFADALECLGLSDTGSDSHEAATGRTPDLRGLELFFGSRALGHMPATVRSSTESLLSSSPTRASVLLQIGMATVQVHCIQTILPSWLRLMANRQPGKANGSVQAGYPVYIVSSADGASVVVVDGYGSSPIMAGHDVRSLREAVAHALARMAGAETPSPDGFVRVPLSVVFSTERCVVMPLDAGLNAAYTQHALADVGFEVYSSPSVLLHQQCRTVLLPESQAYADFLGDPGNRPEPALHAARQVDAFCFPRVMPTLAADMFSKHGSVENALWAEYVTSDGRWILSEKAAPDSDHLGEWTGPVRTHSRDSSCGRSQGDSNWRVQALRARSSVGGEFGSTPPEVFSRAFGSLISESRRNLSVKIQLQQVNPERAVYDISPQHLATSSVDALIESLTQLHLSFNSAELLVAATRDSDATLIGYEVADDATTYKLYIRRPSRPKWQAISQHFGSPTGMSSPPSFFAFKWTDASPTEFAFTEYRASSPSGASAGDAVAQAFGASHSDWSNAAMMLAAPEHPDLIDGGEKVGRGSRVLHLLDVRDTKGRRSVDLAARPRLRGSDLRVELAWLSELAELGPQQTLALVNATKHRSIERVIGGRLGDGQPFLTLYCAGDSYLS